VGCGWICAGLHPARKRSNGGLGALEDSPQLNKWPPRAGGLYALLLLCFFLAKPNTSVRQPGRGKSRKGDRPPVPASAGGAVAEPAGEPNKGRRLDWPRFYQSGTGQGQPTMRKNEEGGKHDGVRHERGRGFCADE